MGVIDNLKNLFAEDEPGEHDAPEHKVDNAQELDWKASDFSEGDLVDDDWIKRNTKEAD